jgi:hypothetical protein
MVLIRIYKLTLPLPFIIDDLSLIMLINWIEGGKGPDTGAALRRRAHRLRNIGPGSSNKHLNKLISILEQPLKIINWFNAL